MDDLVANQKKIKGNGSFSIHDHSTNWARIFSRLIAERITDVFDLENYCPVRRDFGENIYNFRPSKTVAQPNWKGTGDKNCQN
jgi:hypothetical protein|tara:strand:+ start:248 stop:496 length:249 start_codon:yes stop_codon:yes gene_type:complete